MRSEFCPCILRNANIVIKTIMENREQQILSEIRQMISSMRDQLNVMETRLKDLSQNIEIEDVDETPIDIDIEDVFVDFPGVETVAEPVVEAVAEAVVETVVEPVVEVSAAPVVEAVVEPEQDDLPDDDLPFVEDPASDVSDVIEEPVVEMLIDAAAANAKPTVIDAMAAKEAWRTAIPGSPVKDIRSAISLHDRIIFINGLFDEDPMFFQEVLTAINSMSSLDEVVAYLRERRPEWDMNSDEVYRFMMAVRRRIQ